MITTCLTYALNSKGIDTVPYKPVQCNATLTEGKLISPDVEVYKSVYQPRENEELNTYLYEPKVSPHLAAKLANEIIQPEKIVKQYQKLAKQHDLVLVEGSGGLAVPLIDEHYGNAELVNDLQIPLVIVTSAMVGTLNHTAMTVSYAKSKNIKIKGIIINNYPSNPSVGVKDNVTFLEKMTGVPVIGIVPQMEDIEKHKINSELLDRMVSSINLSYFK